MTILDPNDDYTFQSTSRRSSQVARYWVAVVSHDHVRVAVEGGFFQSNHGKEAPLKRIARGDRVLFYSPSEKIRSGEPIQAFTATGEVIDDEPYQAVQSQTFKPFRRRVRYEDGSRAIIRPLLETLSFSRGRSNWGQVLRRGLFEINGEDYATIAAAMGVRPPVHHSDTALR